ncbi:putative LigA [Burkholderia vietnamiensis]|nr:putative LigA [Burkholderia vietnamiensis]
MRAWPRPAGPAHAARLARAAVLPCAAARPARPGAPLGARRVPAARARLGRAAAAEPARMAVARRRARAARSRRGARARSARMVRCDRRAGLRRAACGRRAHRRVVRTAPVDALGRLARRARQRRRPASLDGAAAVDRGRADVGGGRDVATDARRAVRLLRDRRGARARAAPSAGTPADARAGVARAARHAALRVVAHDADTRFPQPRRGRRRLPAVRRRSLYVDDPAARLHPDRVAARPADRAAAGRSRHLAERRHLHPDLQRAAVGREADRVRGAEHRLADGEVARVPARRRPAPGVRGVRARGRHRLPHARRQPACKGGQHQPRAAENARRIHRDLRLRSRADALVPADHDGRVPARPEMRAGADAASLLLARSVRAQPRHVPRGAERRQSVLRARAVGQRPVERDVLLRLVRGAQAQRAGGGRRRRGRDRHRGRAHRAQAASARLHVRVPADRAGRGPRDREPGGPREAAHALGARDGADLPHRQPVRRARARPDPAHLLRQRDAALLLRDSAAGVPDDPARVPVLPSVLHQRVVGRAGELRGPVPRARERRELADAGALPPFVLGRSLRVGARVVHRAADHRRVLQPEARQVQRDRQGRQDRRRLRRLVDLEAVSRAVRAQRAGDRGRAVAARGRPGRRGHDDPHHARLDRIQPRDARRRAGRRARDEAGARHAPHRDARAGHAAARRRHDRRLLHERLLDRRSRPRGGARAVARGGRHADRLRDARRSPVPVPGAREPRDADARRRELRRADARAGASARAVHVRPRRRVARLAYVDAGRHAAARPESRAAHRPRRLCADVQGCGAQLAGAARAETRPGARLTRRSHGVV